MGVSGQGAPDQVLSGRAVVASRDADRDVSGLMAAGSVVLHAVMQVRVTVHSKVNPIYLGTRMLNLFKLLDTNPFTAKIDLYFRSEIYF